MGTNAIFQPLETNKQAIYVENEILKIHAPQCMQLNPLPKDISPKICH